MQDEWYSLQEPLWSHKPQMSNIGHTSPSPTKATSMIGEPIVLVLNDLGCCHNVLQHLVPYAGFGVRPPINKGTKCAGLSFKDG